MILAGVHLHACVRAAAVECLERGYAVRVAEDGVASNDPIHAAATRRWLAERCVEFAPVSVILGRAPGLVHYSPRATGERLLKCRSPARRKQVSPAAAARNGWEQWRRIAPASRRQLLD